MIIVEYFVETWHVPVCLVSLIWVFYEILVWFQRISALRDIGSVWWTWPLILFHCLFSLFPWGCRPVIFSKLNAYKSVHWYRRGHWVTASSQHISSWLEDLQLWWGSCPGYTRSMSIFFVVCRCGRPWWQGVSQFLWGFSSSVECEFEENIGTLILLPWGVYVVESMVLIKAWSKNLFFADVSCSLC
jgi:hypothetical protein